VEQVSDTESLTCFTRVATQIPVLTAGNSPTDRTTFLRNWNKSRETNHACTEHRNELVRSWHEDGRLGFVKTYVNGEVID